MLPLIFSVVGPGLADAQGRRGEPAKTLEPATTAISLPKPDGATCGPHRDTIVALADRILAERGELKGFKPKQFGTLALFLKVRQLDLPLAEGLALMREHKGSRRDTPRQLDDLMVNFAISKMGVDRGLAITGQRPLDTFMSAFYTVQRQMILADEGASFFRHLQTVRADPELNEDFKKWFFGGMAVAGYLLDQDDAFKYALAQRAIEHDEILMAGMLLGSMQDLTAFYELAETPAAKEIGIFPKDYHLMSNGLTGLTQSAAPVRHEEKPEMIEYRRKDFDIVEAMQRQEGMAWLGIVYNQTGRQDEVAAAARSFLSAIDAEAVDPVADMEFAWVALAEMLQIEMGFEDTARTMGSFDLSRTVRHYAGRASETVDWMTALVEFDKFMSGRAATLPDQPNFMSDAVDWGKWGQVAVVVRDEDLGVLSGNDPMAVRIAVELLYRSGRVAEAVELSAKIEDVADRLSIYRDLMRRLDLRCDGFTYLPSGGLTLGGAPMLTFTKR